MIRNFSIKLHTLAILCLTFAFSSVCGIEKKGIVKADASGTPECPGSFFVQADFLFWKVRQEGSDLLSSTARTTSSSKVISSTTSEQISRTQRTFHRLHFDGRCGFRAGAGYRFTDCDWAISSIWTHYHGHASLGHSNTRGHWNLSYNILDTLTTREFSLGLMFNWKFFGGFRAAKIDQKLDAVSHSTRSFSNPTSDMYLTKGTLDGTDKIRSHYKGIGPLVGANLTWWLGKGFSIYADVDGALLYSHYSSKISDSFEQESTTFSTTDPTTVDVFNFRETARASTNTCQLVLDLGLGVSWHRYTCLCTHTINTVIKLGWEHAQWFDHNAVGRSGDLSFDGLTLSAQIQF